MEADFSKNHPPELLALSGLLAARGFERTTEGTFTNGRATIRLDECEFVATPGNGDKSWRADIRNATPAAFAQLLGIILAAPSFLSQAELDRLEVRRHAAEAALDFLAESIRENPDTHSGQHLRRFVWSLFNGHHALNLWRMKDVLDSQHNASVREVFAAWIDGQLSEDAIRNALFASGEMDRWDTVRLLAPDRKRLVDAFDAVTDLLNSIPPGAPSRELTRVNALLRQVMDCLRDV